MMKLGVNIDHIASLRELRRGRQPDPILAASICGRSGADSVVVHLRKDRRHIKDDDLFMLAKTIRKKLNLEMSIAPEIVNIACKVKPDQATLVPEKRQELTTEGGLDVKNNFKKIMHTVGKLKRRGISVSLFIDPERKQIDASKDAGAEIIEIHTGRYANAKNKKERDYSFKEIAAAARYAKSKGLEVAAGHGLDYQNVSRLKKIKELEELNIGYSIICRAVFIGLDKAVRGMKELI